MVLHVEGIDIFTEEDIDGRQMMTIGGAIFPILLYFNTMYSDLAVFNLDHHCK